MRSVGSPCDFHFGFGLCSEEGLGPGQLWRESGCVGMFQWRWNVGWELKMVLSV